MYDDIAEFKRFYQARLGQNVADLIRRQLDLFWHAGSPLASAFLGYAQPFLDPKNASTAWAYASAPRCGVLAEIIIGSQLPCRSAKFAAS